MQEFVCPVNRCLLLAGLRGNTGFSSECTHYNVSMVLFLAYSFDWLHPEGVCGTMFNILLSFRVTKSLSGSSSSI
jgi:hypothetical protein